MQHRVINEKCSAWCSVHTPYNARFATLGCPVTLSSLAFDAERAPQPLGFAQVQAMVREDMLKVDALIRRRLGSEVILVNQVAEHIVAAGGKRLRPMLVLLAARAAGYRGSDHHQAAAIVEFIHTATLLHDDVVDESGLRRGRQTANALFGNAASVLVGDYLYSRAFQLMVELDRMRIMQVLADTTNAIAEGEVLQLMHIGNPDTDEAAYLRVIERKTAVLFSAACRIGAILAAAPSAVEQALADYGMALGYAFQIADDVMDYTSDAQTMGKNVGDDLAEGKPTLPLIYALQHSPAENVQALRRVIETGGLESLDLVIASIKDSGALEYTERRANDYALAALAALASVPGSVEVDALKVLADHAVARRS
jgi:octaprenyl-diphosphate synthase